jgi:transcriptional regulator with XRE-family HTH domain
MDAKKIIGQYIRKLREEKNLSQEELAHASGITYQYLSGVENGRENFTIGVLDSVSKSLNTDLKQLVSSAFLHQSGNTAPTVKAEFFRPDVPLPAPLEIDHVRDALNETQRIINLINASLIAISAQPLFRYVQGKNFSGIISNLLCNSLSELSPFKHNSHQSYPDLIAKDPLTNHIAGLEVKTTIQIGKGGESHNGHAGWHLIGCFQIDQTSGDISFVHIMVAKLHGHNHSEPDWKYVRSKINEVTGSRRTETYNTTLEGTTKLRDGSVYLDPRVVSYQRWRQARKGNIPKHSIFWQT